MSFIPYLLDKVRYVLTESKIYLGSYLRMTVQVLIDNHNVSNCHQDKALIISISKVLWIKFAYFMYVLM